MKKHIATFTATVAGALFLAGLANAALDNATSYECVEVTLTAFPGDTLWGMADYYCTGHIGSAVHDMAELNGVTTLQVGDKITLP